ncbi:L-serine ammonia-lyase, iron-sulfur-dependent, subunit alpha [Mogibacterium neglectum]|uniref:L-cysteine desulfidase family protein n=1 Tax=Mogibacterium neglectum TaxID=114528 RepID=UPI00272B770D|nr:L-serine ammonia-lyase, iron-sulfur-dependent, subunit alpha [Mogibacterium neglectum]WLD76791.1 L-serine ammonia-lyase, iron-sulfur-dependent, subunit alpha [Mogibacterium neglectum]
MHELIELLKKDMKPALGVTEPGAIAFAVSTACSYLESEADSIDIRLNSGIYKNAFTCGIPSSPHVGNLYAAALGAIAADHSKGLECLSSVTPADNKAAERMIAEGRINVLLSEVSSRIHIEATVRCGDESAEVIIWDAHTNITCIKHNGRIIKGSDSPTDEQSESTEPPIIHKYTLQDFVNLVNEVPYEDIEFIKDAYRINLDLYKVSMDSDRTTFAKSLYAINGNKTISSNAVDTASLLCNAAIEARVLGLDAPAMSITGSGAHGIIATLPLYGYCKIHNIDDEKLIRATALSYLICTYIKEYSGKLSAFCGCAIAAGSGMASALVYLDGGDTEAISRCLNNMASSITGMICDGGNHGCVMKGVSAVDTAFRSKDFAMAGICIENLHGINGSTPEETMRNMGLIASPGMVKTEETILDIMKSKLHS